MTVKYMPESCDMGDEFGKKQFPVIGKGICGRCERYDGGDTDPQRTEAMCGRDRGNGYIHADDTGYAGERF